MADHLPLNALRSFECAARCGGFVQAGKELGVSSAAVSQQVKNLEAYYGKELFLRRGNKIFLTDAGESIYPDVAGALEQLSHTSEKLQRSRKREQFVISVLPILSEFWVLPRLAQLSASLGVSIDIRVENDPIDFEHSGVDLRLTYDSRYYKEYFQSEILTDVVVPTCSLAFWQRHGNSDTTLRTVPAQYFLHNHWGPAYASEPSWEDWFRPSEHPENLRETSRYSFSDTTLVISAARRGLGIALAPRSFLKEDLEVGRLILPSEITLPMTYTYAAICPHAKRQTTLMKKMFAAFEPEPEKPDNP